MPGMGNEKTPEYYRDLKLRRDQYRNKLIAKGVHPRSMKMIELMCRKFKS